MRQVAWVLLSIGAAFGQIPYGSVGGPLSGYVGDVPTQSIRPIVGVPGGAHLGAAVLQDVARAWVAPEGARAVILRQDRYFLVSGLETGIVRTEEAALEIPGPEAVVAWSADGTAVVVGSNGRLQVAKWGEAEKVWAVDGIREVPEGPISALAVDPKLGAVAVALANTGGGAVYAGWSRQDPLELIYEGEAVGALAFTHTGETLYVADRAAGQILSFIRSGARTDSAITSDREEYRDVIALAVASDDSALYSVHAERRVVVRHGIADRSIHTVNVEGVPSRIVSIPASGLFIVAVREKATDAVLALDVHSDALYFIPGGDLQ